MNNLFSTLLLFKQITFMKAVCIQAINQCLGSVTSKIYYLTELLSDVAGPQGNYNSDKDDVLE